MYLGIANLGYTDQQVRIKSRIDVAVDRAPHTQEVNFRAMWGKRQLSLWFYETEFDAIARELGYERKPF